MLISILTVLSILTAISSLTVVYPKVVLTVVYPKVILTVVYPKVVLTVVFIPTVVYILTVVSSLSDYSPQHSPQHSPHSYFHVIFISAYPAVRVKFYAYVNMLDRNDIITNELIFAGKESCRCKPATTRREETNAGTTQMTALVKGFHVLKDHMLNRLMTGRCLRKSLQLWPKFHSLFLQNSFDFF